MTLRIRRDLLQLCVSRAVATYKYSRLLLPKNYVRLVALMPNSLRASFYSVKLSYLYSTIVKLLPLFKTY